MKRSLSQLLAGERIPHPDDPDAQEALDLLILADGPWNEQRLATATPRVVAARKWVEFVRQLRDPATEDLDEIAYDIDVGFKTLSARTSAQQIQIDRSKLNRARDRLRTAREQQAAIRSILLLDEEEPDGRT